MTGNFIMLQMDDLRQVVTEIVEEVCTKRGLNEKPSEEEGEWLTREEVCDMLHITYTTLWRKENEGVIKKHKMGRRNLYSKKEVMEIFSSAIADGDNNKKVRRNVMGEQTKFMNSIALATINAVRAEVAHVSDTGLPLDVFPAKVQEIILDLAAEDNFPVEYTAVAMLSAVSAAIGNTRHIRLKPSWESNPSLYIILVGEPGQGKTPPLDFAYKPIEDHDYAMYIKFKDEMELYNATADKGKSDVGSGKEKPVLIQTILSDSTPESLWRLHNDNQRGVVLLIDEILGFFHSVCRYNDNPFMSQLLTAYTGKQVKVTRCNNPIPAIIRKPCINVIGTTQTERIHELFTDENVNSGLIDRFMFVIPKEVRPTLGLLRTKRSL